MVKYLLSCPMWYDGKLNTIVRIQYFPVSWIVRILCNLLFKCHLGLEIIQANGNRDYTWETFKQRSLAYRNSS